MPVQSKWDTSDKPTMRKQPKPQNPPVKFLLLVVSLYPAYCTVMFVELMYGYTTFVFTTLVFIFIGGLMLMEKKR